MSIIDKARVKATQLTHQAKEKVEDLKESRRADALLEELGGIAFRQHIGRSEVGDVARSAAIVAELRAIDAEHRAEHGEPSSTVPPPPAPG
jgi:hypothetical protein